MFRFIFWILIFLGLSAAGIGYYYYGADTSGGLTGEVVKPDRVLVGVPFTLKVAVGNDGRVALDDAKVALSLPEGAAFVGSNIHKTIETKSLGKLGTGSVLQEEFEVIIVRGEREVKRFTVIGSYLPQGGSSRFEKSFDADVAADTSGLAL